MAIFGIYVRFPGGISIKKMMILIGLYSGFLCATARESTIPPRQQQINAVDDGLDSGLYVLSYLR